SAAIGITVAADGAEPISVSRPAEPCAGRLLMAWEPISGAGGTRVKSTGAPTVSPGRSAPVSSLRVTAVIGPSERTRPASVPSATASTGLLTTVPAGTYA